MTEMRPSAGRKAAGLGLLVLGALGTVLPILQGALFIALGLFVLRHQYGWAQRGWGWAETRWPEAALKVEAMEGRLIAWGRRQAERLRRLVSAA